MEKFMIINNQELINQYNAHKEWEKKVIECFRVFKKLVPMEATRFYLNATMLAVELTKSDLENFNGQIIKNSRTDFKKNSKTAKEWKRTLESKGISTEENVRPIDLWLYMRSPGGGRFSYTTFMVDGVLYGRMKADADFTTPEWVTEIKASEYHKVIEDYNERLKIGSSKDN